MRLAVFLFSHFKCGGCVTIKYVILIFILVPAAEIALFLLAGETIGILPTIGLILFTGIFGAFFAKRQGLEVVRNSQQHVQQGLPPGQVLIDGVCVLVGGVMLISPGFITDIVGLALLIPYTRTLFKPLLFKLFRNWTNRKNMIIMK